MFKLMALCALLALPGCREQASFGTHAGVAAKLCPGAAPIRTAHGLTEESNVVHDKGNPDLRHLVFILKDFII